MDTSRRVFSVRIVANSILRVVNLDELKTDLPYRKIEIRTRCFTLFDKTALFKPGAHTSTIMVLIREDD